MQTTLNPPPKRPKEAGGPLSSKNGSIAAAAVTAAIAGLLIVLFLNQYRNNVHSGGVPTGVVVAQQLIEKGASAQTVGAQGAFKSTKVPKDQLKAGAVTDAGKLNGRIAVGDILPGQQITAADFKAAGHGLVTKLDADQRAVTVSLDGAHGLIGKISAGDHVDVLSGFLIDNAIGRQTPVLRTLMQDVLVLDVPGKASTNAIGGGANQTSEVTLRVATRAAPKLAFASDNGKLWLVLRPQNGATVDSTTLVTLQSMLLDAKALKLPRGAR